MRWCSLILWSALMTILLTVSYLVVRFGLRVHGVSSYYAGLVLVAAVFNLVAYRRCQTTRREE